MNSKKNTTTPGFRSARPHKNKGKSAPKAARMLKLLLAPPQSGPSDQIADSARFMGGSLCCLAGLRPILPTTGNSNASHRTMIASVANYGAIRICISLVVTVPALRLDGRRVYVALDDRTIRRCYGLRQSGLLAHIQSLLFKVF